MSRWTYFAKRLVLSIPVILFGTTITFFVIYAGPIDPAYAILGQQATPERVEEIHRQLGMNQPLWQQYIDYLGRVLQGNIGESFLAKAPVSERRSHRRDPSRRPR